MNGRQDRLTIRRARSPSEWSSGQAYNSSSQESKRTVVRTGVQFVEPGVQVNGQQYKLTIRRARSPSERSSGQAYISPVEPGVQVNGRYYRDVLLIQELLPDIRQLSDFYMF